MQEVFDIETVYNGVLESPTGVDALGLIAEFFTLLNSKLDSIGWVLEEAQYLDEGFGNDYREKAQGLRQTLHHFASRLQDEGVLRVAWSVDGATDFLVALTTLGTWRDLTRDFNWTADEYRDRLLDWLRIALLEPSIESGAK